ncbi:class I SAM-dependent methyltransferase [Pelagibius sp. CAU 1746]|uniref:class I SAM-dependent methyltransferase n=1 Tax=Pelagibius sp. CAU 1746 TaxID=3140370 RepID=UPI00325A6C8D
MNDDRLYDDPDLVQFYDLENGWGPDFEFCAGLAKNARSVLDLGCGTGELAAKLSEKCEVVGVDPAASMLAVARTRPGGSQVTWVEGDARDLRLDRRFDLILLTGHAFQVFLTPEDQLAALRTMALHLNPRGRFLFDSRNPAAEAWKNWVPEKSRRQLQHPILGAVEAWNDATFDAASGIVTYETHYHAVESGKHLTAASQIRFTPRDELELLISEAGLHVSQWQGDWQGGPCTPASKELIPLGGLVQLTGN